ncbi:hypothetical protein TNCV_2006101 [Trichonephila clavipes]|nr:hypothetical protein TNCV_2006101 [Trichonephila clavipes]
MMSSRRFRKPYRQLNDFERGRAVGSWVVEQWVVTCKVQTQLFKGAGSDDWCEELIDEINALKGQDA